MLRLYWKDSTNTHDSTTTEQLTSGGWWITEGDKTLHVIERQVLGELTLELAVELPEQVPEMPAWEQLPAWELLRQDGEYRHSRTGELHRLEIPLLPQPLVEQLQQFLPPSLQPLPQELAQQLQQLSPKVPHWVL